MSEITEPTINSHGDEVHPSFGVVVVSRVNAHPGVRLFDSSIPHTQYVKLEIARATRKRDLHHDWIHHDTRSMIEIEMSLSQWGALVSSFGQGSGTPVTIHRVDGVPQPKAAHESRLAETSREVADAARRSTEQVRTAANAVLAAFQERKGVRDTAPLMRDLQAAVGNLPANMKFAADTLTRHAEDVVSKARVDIEAAHQFGGTVVIDPAAEVLEIDNV